ncbi:hypothetical protein QUG92_15745 [Curtobacterium sp. RHCKG23]|uniref:DNA-binding protein n=1 Tax=Curtobacterium citri TaxID=3055139 RepID=A0ABT7TB28_9MICO|nr:hypothetical protein [Curtobacterium citri]MDM7886564.1 hypothetical protein [Curtobacterium citri]
MSAAVKALLMLEPLRRRPSFPSLLTPEQTAVTLGVSVDELDVMRAEGTGPIAFAVSPRVVRYSPAGVEAWKSHRSA